VVDGREGGRERASFGSVKGFPYSEIMSTPFSSEEDETSFRTQRKEVKTAFVVTRFLTTNLILSYRLLPNHCLIKYPALSVSITF